MGASLVAYNRTTGKEISRFTDPYNSTNLLWLVAGSYTRMVVEATEKTDSPEAYDLYCLEYLRKQLNLINRSWDKLTYPDLDVNDTRLFFKVKAKQLELWLENAYRPDVRVEFEI